MVKKQVYVPELDMLIDIEEPQEEEVKEVNEAQIEQLMEDGWLVPLSTEFISDKKFDYQYYAILTYISNQNREEIHRYLYEKGSNSISSNKQFIEQMSKSCWQTVRRNIKKLSEHSHGIVTARYNEEGKIDYYIINPYVKKEDSKSKKAQGMYVTIPSQIVKVLFSACSSNAIKVYCTLAWLCREGEKQVTRSWLAKEIGLSTNSTNNLNEISNILWWLDDKVIKVRKVWESDDRDLVTKCRLYVRLMTLQEVKDSKKKVARNSKK